MHSEFDHAKEKDVGGGVLTSDEHPSPSTISNPPTFKGAADDKSHEFEEEDGHEYPTEEEINTLEHVSFALHPRAWLVCIIELSERFCYYGVSGCFNNYITNPYGDGTPYTDEDLPGAIGRGSAFASGLQNYWQFWCYGWSYQTRSKQNRSS